MKRLAVVAALALAGCGKNTGATCTSHSDCDDGLKCMFESYGVPGSGGMTRCVSLGKHCTAACSGDADCDSLGDGLQCFANCSELSPTCRPAEDRAE